MLGAGLSTEESVELHGRYGENALNIEVPSYLALLYQELFSPFLVFQMFSIILWMLESYYLFAMGILGFAFVTLGMNLVETRRNLSDISRMARLQSQVRVRRAGHPKFVKMDAAELVPGDIIQIEDHMALPCDAVLLHGTCIMNESMLTGESVPVMKTPVDVPISAAGDRIGTHAFLAFIFGLSRLVLGRRFPVSSGLTKQCFGVFFLSCSVIRSDGRDRSRQSQHLVRRNASAPGETRIG